MPADGSLQNALCTVVAKPHPFDCDTVYAQVQAGQTLAQMLGEGMSQTLSVTIDGYAVPRELWARVKPKAGKTVHVTAYPQGGNAGKLLKIVAIIVISYFTMGAGSAGAAAWLGVSTTTLGIIGMVAIMAVNALIPPPTPKGLGTGNGGDPFSQLASLTGTSNQASPYGVIPCVVGSTRLFPPHAALPYTEISGDDQYLRMLLDLGYGDLDISDIRIGETDIASYDDVEWEISTTPTLFTQDIFELSVGVALTNVNDTALRTTQTASREISLDIIFGSGLFGVDDRGNTTTATCPFAIQYRPTGSSTWLDLGSATGLTFTGGMKLMSGNLVQVSNGARKTLRCGIRWTVPSGQYDVQVTRGNASFPGASAQGHIGDAAWSVLRSVNPQNPTTTGTLKLAVRIKATDQLNGVVQNLSVLAAQKVRRWDATTSTWLTPVASTNPAWIYLWLMTQCPAVMRRLADSRMDIPGIADWADECTAKGYAIGFVMDSGRAFGDIVRDVLAAGRASFGLRNSLYSAVRDIAQTVPVQMFTPANSWGFSYSRSFADLPHALRVSFTNPEASYQQDVRVVYADGYTSANATRFEELDLRMVIDPDAAWRLGRYHLAVIWNRPNQYTFQADIEHMVCERGDLVHVAHDITGWGVAWGRVKAISGSTVTLDGPVTLEAGKTYAFRIRRADNTQVTETITSPAGDLQTLTLANPLTTGDVGDLYVVGEVNRGVAQLIVRKVEPGDDLTATITAVDAAPAVWTADSGTPPAFVSDITGKAWCAAPAPPIVHIRAGDSAANDAGVIKAVTGVGSNPQGGIYRFPTMGRGGGCVVVESFLPDMRRAGDVAVGDTLAMADPGSLGDRTGTVTYSQPVMQPCVEIITASGAVLRCSLSAPIPTEHDGIVLAPHLAGKRVGVRDGEGVRWEPVSRIRSLGQRLVQHISVDDGCFWAGAEPGRYILHHNKLAARGATD
jgi:hypothetical protein